MTAVATVVTMVLAGCSAAGRGTGGVGPPPASMETWVIGDSISVGYAAHYPGPIGSEAVSGASFVYTNGGTVGTIGQNTSTLIGWFGVPGTFVMMGGVNDARYRVNLDVVKAEIVQLTDELSAGARVIHVTQPSWTYRLYMTELNSWLLATYPDTIDCAPLLTDPLLTADGVHPTSDGYKILAGCVSDGLAARAT